MKPPEDIKRYFKKATLSTNPEKHEAIFEKILSAHEQVNEREPESSRINLGRIIMKSPITKLATAAMIVIACIAGLTMIDRKSNVVLANVLTKIEKISTYMFDINMTMTGQITNNTEIDAEMKGTTLFSNDYGIKTSMETTMANSPISMSQSLYLLLKDKALIEIIPTQKRYSRFKIDDDYVEIVKTQSYDPGKAIGQILSCKYNDLGISKIDGKTVSGFQTNDPNYAGGMYSTVDVTIWVDVETQLPVQIQMDFETAGQTNTKLSGFVNNFQWNVSVNASEFEPVIPDDYTSSTSTSLQMPPNTEEAAIEGLKQYADFFGNYPKEINLISFISKMSTIEDINTPAGIQFNEELNGLTQEEKSQKQMDIMTTIVGAAQFYMLLVQDQKNPAYYGDRVSPGESAQVLMRWKVSDNDYRVIFGDLKVETLTKQTLDLLEKSLPEKEDSEN